MSAAPLRVTLIGFGYAGRTFHAPLIAAEPGLRLEAVASSDPAKVATALGAVRVIGDPLEAVRDSAIDLVVIATPNDSHAPLARAALAAGKHVVVDKPMALDLGEARDLVDCAKAAGRMLTVFHNRRWDSDFLALREAMASGALGEIAHYESHFDRHRPQVRDRWRENAGPGSGVWFDLGPHLVDQALLLFGLPDRVMASFARQRPGAQAVDWAHAVLEYPRLRVVLHAAMLVPGAWNSLTVHGTRASFVKRGLDVQEAQLVAGLAPGEPGWGEDGDTPQLHGEHGVTDLPPARGDSRAFYRAVVAAIAGGGAAPVQTIEALAVMAVIAAAEDSANSGGYTRIPLSAAERSAYQLHFTQSQPFASHLHKGESSSK